MFNTEKIREQLLEDNKELNIFTDDINNLSDISLYIFCSILYEESTISIDDVLFDKLEEYLLNQKESIDHPIYKSIINTPREKYLDMLKSMDIGFYGFVSAVLKVVQTEIGMTKDRYYHSINDMPPIVQKLITTWQHPKSIKAFRTRDEFTQNVLMKYKQMGIVDVIVSMKYDGWNSCIYLYPNHKGILGAHNRSRGTDKYIDLTDIMMNILSIDFDKVEQPTRITGELILTKVGFQVVQEYQKINNSKKFVSARSAVAAIVSGNITMDVLLQVAKTTKFMITYPHEILKFKAFNLDLYNENLLDYEDQLGRLKSLGLEIIDYTRVNLAPVLNDIQNGANWLYDNFDRLYINKESDFQYFNIDGMVIIPNKAEDMDKLSRATNSDTVSNRNIYSGIRFAYKAGPWAMKIYSTKIIGFHYSYGSDYFKYILDVEPTKTNRGIVTNVPIQYSNLLNDKLDIGDTIIFSDRGDIAVTYESKL